MPRFDGLKPHAFAREMERYRETKFIFISGLKMPMPTQSI